MSYKQQLTELYFYHEKSDKGRALVTKQLQKAYHGNYTVVEYYLPEKFCWGPKLVFEDKQEEIMFLLRHS